MEFRGCLTSFSSQFVFLLYNSRRNECPRNVTFLAALLRPLNSKFLNNFKKDKAGFKCIFPWLQNTQNFPISEQNIHKLSRNFFPSFFLFFRVEIFSWACSNGFTVLPRQKVSYLTNVCTYSYKVSCNSMFMFHQENKGQNRLAQFR